MGLSLRKKALFLAIACMPLSVVLADGDGVTSENVAPPSVDLKSWGTVLPVDLYPPTRMRSGFEGATAMLLP